MKVTRSEAVSHPEGWFLFKIESEEESAGKFGTQCKFHVRSECKNEDTGEAIRLTHYTGAALSVHENCKLTDLFIACGILGSREELEQWTDEEFDGIDTAILLGKVFEGRVDEPKIKGGYPKIGAVRPRKASQKAAPAKKAPKQEPDETDPFADE